MARTLVVPSNVAVRFRRTSTPLHQEDRDSHREEEVVVGVAADITIIDVGHLLAVEETTLLSVPTDREVAVVE